MALSSASGLWGNLLLKGLFTHNRGRGTRGPSENEQLTGGVLSGRQEQLKWLPVGSSKVWWSQRDLNTCFIHAHAFAWFSIMFNDFEF